MKRARARRDDSGAQAAPTVGDHLAMDLLNTEARSQGRVVDYWNTDKDVLQWLARHDVVQLSKSTSVAAEGLLAHARTLRAHARELIAKRKEGKAVDIRGLNQYLRAYVTSPQLERDSEGRFKLTRIPRADAISSLLGPVAEAVAQLLVESDFDLVKQCEHPDCILWFYDRTKSHKRRWCSMAQCGNRYKAAQFRRRSSAETA